ncbi:ketopantoate reductase family protein [Bacillus daqingensis]|uniref:2-dehydropantoate 2-reductase n=1 Tax=Bacillus daqingensis TaxID=872396 RepID=A0ABV9NRJ3_9BACI
MKIGIAGGGALGLLCTAHLMAQGHDVFLKLRNREQIQKIEDEGICLEQEDRMYQYRPRAGRESTEEPDLWLCTVKQHHISELFDNWKPAAPMLMLQNGIGHMDIIPEGVEAYPAVVTHGALRTSLHEVRHTGDGMIAVPLTGKREVEELIRQSGKLNVSEVADIKTRIHKKLIMNAVINPLTVLYEKPNGYLLENPEAEEEAQKLCIEAAAILDMEKLIWEDVKQLIRMTARNRSSMLADYEAGRPLELQAINGALITMAGVKGAPHHERIVYLVRKKEAER